MKMNENKFALCIEQIDNVSLNPAMASVSSPQGPEERADDEERATDEKHCENVKEEGYEEKQRGDVLMERKKNR